jgi:hypothetical protein
MTPNGPTLWACGQSRVPGTRRIEHEHEDDWAGRCAGFPAMRSHEALGIVGWCQGGELNSRPRAYEETVLPRKRWGKDLIKILTALSGHDAPSGKKANYTTLSQIFGDRCPRVIVSRPS